MVEFKTIDRKEWDKFPTPQPTTPTNRWENVLVALESGGIVELQVPEDKLRGTRIGLARSASTRGFKLVFRYDHGRLAVRRSDTLLEPREPKARKPRAKKGQNETSEETPA